MRAIEAEHKKALYELSIRNEINRRILTEEFYKESVDNVPLCGNGYINSALDGHIWSIRNLISNSIKLTPTQCKKIIDILINKGELTLVDGVTKLI